MSLDLQSIQVSFHGRELFSPVSLLIPQGEVATIMGPSGCGKSTLLAAIAGNLETSFLVRGTIVLNGRELNRTPMEQRKVGILFQDDLLFPHFDVLGNLLFALPGEMPRKERIELAQAALVQAGLAGFGERDVATLSGGQRARISLLRTLLAEPEAILLDEPFSRLDKPLRASFREFVHQQISRLQIPALLVTHDEEDSCGGTILQLQGWEENDA